jgi:hypothetical protein
MPEYNVGTNNGLLKKPVDIEDVSFLSADYFVISDLNGNFGLGKNSIIINSPPADIKIDAFDINGTPLYFETAINSDVVNKTRSIIVSFHVYKQNGTGIGKLILYGTFKNGKRVRYVTNIYIDIHSLTTSDVRFYYTPTLEITPLLTFATKTNATEINPKTISGSFYSRGVFPGVNFNVDDNPYNKDVVDYQILINTGSFSASLKSFSISLKPTVIQEYNSTNTRTLRNITESIIIKDVINSTTLQLEKPFTYKNNSNNKQTVTNIISGTYTITYSDYAYSASYFNSQSYLTESVIAGDTRYKKYSIADITYRNLNTFSGLVTRHKVYRKSLNIASDYKLILDENFSEDEVLKNYVVPIKSFQNLGNFYTHDFINKFWYTSSANIQLYSDSVNRIDGMKISGSGINDGYILVKLNTSGSNRDASYVAFNESQYLLQSGSSYDTNFIKLLKDNAYVLSFNCNLVDKPYGFASDIDFYLTGSYVNNQKESSVNSRYGIKLGGLSFDKNTRGMNFHNTIQFKFTPRNDLYGTLVIVPRGMNSVVINNLSIKLDKTEGFSLNSYTVRVPFDVNQPNELFDIKAELYDNESKLVYSDLRTIKLFDSSGSSTPQTSGDISITRLVYNSVPTLVGTIGVDIFPLYIAASGLVGKV